MKQDQEQVKMLENESDSDSDKSSVVLDENERKLLRKNKIWTRRNIIDIENRERQRKYQEKLIMPYPVIEKIKNLNDYELNCMLEESIRFIEGKCLIFDKNDCERVQLNENIYQNRLFKVKNELNKINNIFMEINYRWEQTNKKDNLLAKREDIDTLKNQSLELIKEKDIMISEMVKELEHLVDESLYETKATSDDLFKLQNIATSKIQLINEEYEKNNSHIAELIEEERNKGNDKDNAEWTLLMDKTMTRITNSTLKRLLLIEKNDYELCKQYENNIENAKIIRLDITEKNMGMDSELEFVKLKCSENIYKIIQNCEILKKRIEDNNFNIEDKKQHFYTLQNFLNNIITEHNAIESDNKNQISIIKKGIININNKINDNEKRADEIAKKFNGVYMKSWNLQQNEIIRYINDVKFRGGVIWLKYRNQVIDIL